MRTKPWARRGGGSRRERRCERWGIGWRSCGGGRGTRERRGSRRWCSIRGLRNGQRDRNQVHWAGRGVRGEADQQQRPRGTDRIPLKGGMVNFDYPYTDTS